MDAPAPAPSASTGGIRIVGWVMVSLVLLIGGLFAVLALAPRIAGGPQPSLKKDRVKSLTTLLLDYALSKHGYPPYSGRAFVLSVVPARIVDPAAPGTLDTLFEPEDPAGRAPPSVAEYQALTYARLAAGGDLRRFTSFVGRRNADPDAVLKPGAVMQREPLLAYLYADKALVGFANGGVELLEREELGLRPHDPITAGPNSLSPILRLLGE